MADDYKDSGYAFLGVKKKDFPLYRDFAKEMSSALESNKDTLKEQGTLTNTILGFNKDQATLASVLTRNGKLQKNLSKDELKAAQDSLGAQAKKRDAINEMFPGAVGIAKGIDQTLMSFQALLGPIGIAVGAFAILLKFAMGFAKEIADTRKDLGVSVVTASKLVVANKGLAIAAKGFGLELEDVKSAQNTILKDLGGSVDEALKLSLNFARTSAATGQTSDELGKTLSIMESISSASRDVLLNQIRANAAMIEAQGVAPGLVMRDIAANAEFFAEFAKDGGRNLIMAGTAARKLGLDMSAVADATNSLLEFESSIESSMEASLLLGRQINTDRARMLALTGDQEGLMKEIQRIAGSEQDFNQMNVLQRRALAKSVGQSVEGLARIVRNNQAGATGAAAGGAMGSVAEKQLSTQNQQLEVSRQIADNTRKQANF